MAKRKTIESPNSHKRKIIILTPKQVKWLLSSLKSTAGLRALEKDREYLRKIGRQIEEQVDTPPN